MELGSREMQMYEKCPRCGSLSCETDLSTDNRNTTCSSCGYIGNVSKYREHKQYELPKQNKPKDFFGKEMMGPEDHSYKLNMMKRLDINL